MSEYNQGSKKVMKNKEYWLHWVKSAWVRAIKTVAQTAVATIGTAVAMGEVNWLLVTSSAALAGVLSFLTSVAGLPEVEVSKIANNDVEFEGE